VGLPDRLALGGALSLRAEATLERGALKAVATAQVKDAGAAGLALGAGRLTARVDGQRLQASLDLAERRITGSASGSLAPGGDRRRPRHRDSGLDTVLRHVAASDADVEASVAGRITARVPWDRPAALTAWARFDPIALRCAAPGRGKARRRTL
jgi:hypothetical protein